MAIIKGAVKSITLEEALRIQEQLRKCICKIKGKTQATGFFSFIQYNNKCLPVLVSANHVINLNEQIYNLSLELNSEIKIININDGRKIFINRDLDITIIEIIPEKDNIFNFLDIDSNVFTSNSELRYQDESVYILHYNFNNNKIISYGMIKNIHENTINHMCNTDYFSGGAPILNITTGKIIGIHLGSKMNFNFNFGTFIKIPITKFIDLNKEYINTNGLNTSRYTSVNGVNTLNTNIIVNMNEININNNIGNEYFLEREKTKKLEEKIKELNTMLNDKITKANSIISKNYKEIEELKAKLSRFPFELLEGEKIMSIIITSPDKKMIRSIICKNTDVFCDLEEKIFQNKNKEFDIGNYFTINGRNIDESKSLESNQIKNNDIIVLNKLNV